MNAHAFFPSQPVWHRYVHTTVRITCRQEIHGVCVSEFDANVTVYEDPTDDNQWHIAEMAIVGGESVIEDGKTRWKDKLVYVQRHHHNGRTEEGYLAAAIERAAEAEADTIIEALEKEKHS